MHNWSKCGFFLLLIVFMILQVGSIKMHSNSTMLHEQHLIKIDELSHSIAVLQQRVVVLENPLQFRFFDRDDYKAPEAIDTPKIRACIECHSKPNQDLRRLVELTPLPQVATDDCGRNNHQLGESDVKD